MSLSPSQKSNWLAISIVVILTAAAFSPVVHNDFLQWDDDVHITENLSIRALDREHIVEMFTGTINQIYIPLTSLSFAFEYRFFGLDPFIIHLNNLLLHLAVTVFVFLLGRRLGLSTLACALSALLFGVHPIHVESVAWATERKDVLYAFFYMLALLAYTRGAIVWTTILGILSILAKPMALSLPLILLLMDWFSGRKFDRKVFFEKVPLTVALAAITWISYSAHIRVPGESVTQSVLIWPWTFMYYLRQFVFPAFSVPVVRLPVPVEISSGPYLLSTIGFLAVLGAGVYFRRHKWFIFTLLFYFLSIFFLLRFDDMKDINIVADRFMYLPSVGLCFLFALGVERSIRLFQEKLGAAGRGIVLAVVAFIFIVFAAATYQQTKVWNNSISLWQHQLKFYPNDPVALNNLAGSLKEMEAYQSSKENYQLYLDVLSQEGEAQPSESMRQSIAYVTQVMDLYKRAIVANPEFSDPYHNLGEIYSEFGQHTEALSYFQKAVELDPDHLHALFGLGDTLVKTGDLTQALAVYGRIISLDPQNLDIWLNLITGFNDLLKQNPDNTDLANARAAAMEKYMGIIAQKPSATAYFNLGFLYGEIGQTGRAASAYQMALDINPNHGLALYNLGNIYKEKGKWKEALTLYKRAAGADPQNINIYLNMGLVYLQLGEREKAGQIYQKAIKIDQNSADAYFNLAFIRESSGEFSKSINNYIKAGQLDPKNAEIFYNLGNVYAKMEQFDKAVEVYLKAVAQNPGHVDAWVNLSICSFHKKNYAAAIRYCDEARLLGYDPPQEYLQALEPYRR